MVVLTAAASLITLIYMYMRLGFVGLDGPAPTPPRQLSPHPTPPAAADSEGGTLLYGHV